MIQARDRKILIDGTPRIIMCGEVHYFRLARDDWAGRLKSLKDAGCTAVASYSDHYVGDMTLGTTTDLYVMNAYLRAAQDPGQPLTSLETEGARCSPTSRPAVPAVSRPAAPSSGPPDCPRIRACSAPPPNAWASHRASPTTPAFPAWSPPPRPPPTADACCTCSTSCPATRAPRRCGCTANRCSADVRSTCRLVRA
jgi:hypothetical protein